MDRITKDLLDSGLIMKGQVDRLKAKGVTSTLILKHITQSGFMTMDRLVRYIVEKIRKGTYDLSIIVDYDYIREDVVLKKLAEGLNLEFIDLDNIDVDHDLTNRVPLHQLQKYHALPLYEDDLNVYIAINDPLDIEAKESLQRLFPRKPIKFKVAVSKQIQGNLFEVELQDKQKVLVKKVRDELNSISSIEEQQEASSILLLIDVILSACIKGRASDIHIEPSERNCAVRGRIDGKLSAVFIFPKDIFAPLTSRLKLLANLDIAEKRKPQDGRFSTEVNNEEYDFRISTLPTIYGESIVMRVLDSKKATIPLEESGMDSESYHKLLKGLAAPYGMILVTGPTGSGKTTTLYGALNELKNPADKVITVEDPVEYRMNSIQQVQVNPKVGLSFADALRSILRQDPDKIMIGEIRDHETLEIAIKAALTGHLVISTLHTNDSISAITRMADMGIQHYLLSGAVVAVQAQRLVRKICPNCKIEEDVSASTLEELHEFIPEGAKFYTGQGCKECNETGFAGREMICEVLTISEKLSSLIAKAASKDEMLRQANEDGFVSIFKNGIQKALDGKTSLAEVLKVAK
jgi:general secretion pathway protein E